MAFFTEEQVAILSKNSVRVDFLVEFNFQSETVRVWNGVYKLTTGGYQWVPMHGFMKIDGIGQPGSPQSQSVNFSLSGLPNQSPDLLSLALKETPEANQQLVKIYLQLFDEDWQPVGVPITMWWGFMQPPRVQFDGGSELEGGTQSITMAAENAFFNRSRPPYGRYTDRDQQKRSPGDKFYQFTSDLLFKTFLYPDY